MITTQNNFVSQQTLNHIWQAFENNPVWLWRKNTGQKPFWIYDIYEKLDPDTFKHIWKNNPDPIFLEVFENIKKQAGDKFIPWRFIINKQTQGLDSGIHSDFPKEKQHSRTFILYLNKSWQKEWGGETVFYNDNKEETERCLPEPGKLISYNAQQYHQGLSPSIDTTRITLAVHGKYNS